MAFSRPLGFTSSGAFGAYLQGVCEGNLGLVGLAKGMLLTQRTPKRTCNKYHVALGLCCSTRCDPGEMCSEGDTFLTAERNHVLIFWLFTCVPQLLLPHVKLEFRKAELKRQANILRQSPSLYLNLPHVSRAVKRPPLREGGGGT